MGIVVNKDSQPIGVHNHTVDVTKANPYKDGATGRFTTGGGGGGGTNPGAGSRLGGLMDRARQQGAQDAADKMNTTVNEASSLAIQHGDARTKDAAYAATREINDARERIASGKPDNAKEYMDGASDRLQSLPELAEKAGADLAVVGRLSDLANDAWAARTAFLDAIKD